MRISVEHAACDANGVCVSVAPDVFDLTEDDQLVVRHERPDPQLWPLVEEAVRSCPKAALSISDE